MWRLMNARVNEHTQTRNDRSVGRSRLGRCGLHDEIDGVEQKRHSPDDHAGDRESATARSAAQCGAESLPGQGEPERASNPEDEEADTGDHESPDR